jgi:Mn2+/Fe2+ NRAMP family transporter
MAISLFSSSILVFLGRYRIIERVAMLIGVALALASAIAAVTVLPSSAEIVSGLRPSLSIRIDYAKILPWLGFMLSGAAGMVWYSYWIPAKGYGMAGVEARARRSVDDLSALAEGDRKRLRGWLTQMTLDNTVAVVGALVLTVAFLVLGAEVLRPEGLVPEERQVASTLGRLLGDLWGPIAFWFMIVAVFVGFWDTVLSDQNGHARVFTESSATVVPAAARISEPTRRRIFVVLVLTLFPLVLNLAVGEPVKLLKIAGAIEAAHIPLVALLTLRLNGRLPNGLRPSRLSMVATAAAAAFFVAFAVAYLWSL